ncbi:MAG: 50S ribosomal protein L3 [Desulfatibacillaceae bacterium]|nr:50S ribosomal protein L3 [Desulfatibacillaceae bacterium]
MSKGLLGKKLGMSGVFSAEGHHIPVTVLEVGPCVVTQVKTKATDGYDAVQLGFAPKKSGRVNKPFGGHFAKSGGQAFYFLREFGVENPQDFEVGQTITADLFTVGEHVDVAGVTKGRGFAGAIKRHGFHGGRMTHGGMSKRRVGSIGTSATPSKVLKGKKMPGHYGNVRQTTRNLEIVDVRPEQNLILLKGAVPGSGRGLVEVRKLKFKKGKK